MSLLKKLNSLASSSKDKSKASIQPEKGPSSPSSPTTQPAGAQLPHLDSLTLKEKVAAVVVVEPPKSNKLQIVDFVIDRTLGTLHSLLFIILSPFTNITFHSKVLVHSEESTWSN